MYPKGGQRVLGWDVGGGGHCIRGDRLSCYTGEEIHVDNSDMKQSSLLYIDRQRVAWCMMRAYVADQGQHDMLYP